MKTTLTLFAVVLSVLCIVFLRGQNIPLDPVSQAAVAPYKNTFFDPDPNHPWNQLYGMLFIRPGWDGKLYGLDEMDPLYWRNTRYLLEKPLHQEALALLDKFIQSDSARLIKDPLKRALLQRMLWALFDRWSGPWSDPYDPTLDPFDLERRELQVRLVKIMKSVALSDEEIAALPDNYNLEVAAKAYPAAYDPDRPDQPFLPGTFFSRADWVDLGTARYELVAPVHVQAVSGRSDFHVLLSLPSGRDATLAYLKELHDFQPHWIYDRNKVVFLTDLTPPWANSDLPQVPLFTKFALVRKADLINTQGKPVSSPLTESVQIRVIRTIQPHNSIGSAQSFCFFTLDQTEWHGEAARLAGCQECHSAAGILSMDSYVQFFQDRKTLVPPELQEGSEWSVYWKSQQYNWGLLQAYWFGQN